LAEIDGPVDLRDRGALVSRLRCFKPDAVIHLAALSFVPDSFRSPESTFAVNFMGTLNLLQALAETDFEGRMIYVGTGDAYGRVPAQELPISEERALRPLNPYAVSKAAAEALCYQWSQTGPFEIIIARPFNHIGAGQASTFALSDFARQIAEIAAGQRSKQLVVGNIDVTRDFTDVADVVRAYGLMLTHGRNGEIYNVCSGIERSVRDLLNRLLVLSDVVADVVTDPARYRPSEQARVYGSHKKLSDHTGWQPTVPIDNTLMNLYRYWEKKIGF
jgi:GDP-4-dehydro-6-deoxy-D-mannose reductase